MGFSSWDSEVGYDEMCAESAICVGFCKHAVRYGRTTSIFLAFHDVLLFHFSWFFKAVNKSIP